MNAVTRQPSEIAAIRQQIEGMGSQFQAALPAHIPPERFARVVMTAIQNNGDLLKCDRKSLFNAAMKAAQDGLLPDGREGAMVPYKGEVTWMPMVGGIRKKVRNSGEIATWDVHAVFEGDQFDYELGDEPFIRHKPALKARGALIAVYSIATLKSGEKSRDVMSVEDVEKIRVKSRAQNGPWKDPTFYPEMAKKTVARRHSKVLPMSNDLDDLIRRDDHLYDMEGAKAEAQAGKPKSLAGKLDALADFSRQTDGDVIDEETGEVIDQSNSRSESGPAPTASGEPEAKSPSASGKKPSPDVKSPPSGDGDPVATARARGADARHKGMSRKAVPGEYRQDERLITAFLDGFDSGEAEDREPGEEG